MSSFPKTDADCVQGWSVTDLDLELRRHHCLRPRNPRAPQVVSGSWKSYWRNCVSMDLSSSLRSVSCSVQKLTSWGMWHLLMASPLFQTRPKRWKTGPSQVLSRILGPSWALPCTTADLSHILLNKQNHCTSWSQSCMKLANMVDRETNLLRTTGTKDARKHLKASSKCWPAHQC